MLNTRSSIASSLVALAICSGASNAHAAQFNFFFTSTDDPAVSTPSQALSARANPTVLAGRTAQLSLWVAVDPAFVADHEGLTGAWMDIGENGGQSFGSEMSVFNPQNRWGLQSDPGIPGGPGYTHIGLQFGTLNNFPGPGGAVPDEVWNGLLLYRIATGTFQANAPGALFIEIPFLGGLGYSDYSHWNPLDPDTANFVGGASFGFAQGAFDVDAIARDYYDPSVVVSVPFRNGNAEEGFLADGSFLNGAVRTTTADLLVVPASNPEPATLVLLGLGIALGSKRRR